MCPGGEGQGIWVFLMFCNYQVFKFSTWSVYDFFYQKNRRKRMLCEETSHHECQSLSVLALVIIEEGSYLQFHLLQNPGSHSRSHFKPPDLSELNGNGLFFARKANLLQVATRDTKLHEVAALFKQPPNGGQSFASGVHTTPGPCAGRTCRSWPRGSCWLTGARAQSRALALSSVSAAGLVPWAAAVDNACCGDTVSGVLL